MSGLRGLLQKAGHYFVGNGLTMLSGIISYPILTRVMEPGEYGLMGLVSSALLGSVAVAKLGVSSAGVRFFHEEQRRGDLSGLVSLCMSFVGLMGLLAGLVQGVVGWWLGGALGLLLGVTAPLVLVRALTTVGMSFLRAAEWTKRYNGLDVLGRYLSLGLSLWFVLVAGRGVRGFFEGVLLAEAAALGLALWQVRRLTPWGLVWPSGARLRGLLGFGLPLLAFEMTNILLAFGDRVVVRWLVGEAALGHYTAAYNLGDTLQKFLMFPIALSIQPMYMRLWAEEGEEATRAFLGRAMSFFFLLSIPSVVGLVAVRRPLLLWLAGEAYLDGVDVLPLTFGGYLLYGGYAVLAAGMFLKKKTGWLSVASAVAVLGNLGLNLWLVPGMGIVGAAVATAVAYLGLLVALGVMSFRWLSFPIEWGYALRLLGMSGVMYAAVAWIELGAPWSTLLARVLVGGAVFLGLALGADRRGRALVREILRR